MKNIFTRFAAEPTFRLNPKHINIPFFLSEDNYYGTIDTLSIDHVARLFRKRKIKKDHPLVDRAYRDDNVLEFPTKIYKSKAKFLKHFDKLTGYLQYNFKFYPSSMIDMETEGGCHLNFTMPNVKDGTFSEKFFNNLRNYIINRPSIVWSFLAPTDNKSSTISFEHPLDYRKGNFITLRNREGNYVSRNYYTWETEGESFKRVKRIELRFFVMPKTTREMELHIDFASRLLNWIWDCTAKGKEFPSNRGKIKSKRSYTAEYAVDELKKVCEDLKFDYGRLLAQGKFRNLKERFEYSPYYLA